MISFYPLIDRVKCHKIDNDLGVIDKPLIVVKIVSYTPAKHQLLEWHRPHLDALIAEENWDLILRLLKKDLSRHFDRGRIPLKIAIGIAIVLTIMIVVWQLLI